MRQLSELMDLTGRVALVSGGAGSIGAVIADTLAELGAGVAVLDMKTDACEVVADRLAATYSVPTTAIPVDLTVPASVRQVPKCVEGRLGRLDVLVNCAALVGTSDLEGWSVPFEAQALGAWKQALEVNLNAAFVLTQACTPLLRCGRGSVVNVASIYGVVGPDLSIYAGTDMHSPAAYAASKGGLIQLTRWLATALAPHIRVNAISPGGVWRNQPEDFVARYEARTPLRRMAQEEDLKGAAAYLASGLSGYVTGQNLLVDGGWTAW